MRLASLLFVAAGAFAATGAAQTPMDVEVVKQLVPNGTLATCGYSPVATESRFFGKLANNEKANDSLFGKYTIHGKTGKYVSWYGIVRGITPSAETGGDVTLLVQHHFFDGETDCHIMLVAKSGDGDFLARLKLNPAEIPALALVRVYGKVTAEKSKVPEVAVEYVRVWPWMTFTFTDLAGEDHSNPRWQKYASVKYPDKLYVPYPKENYYRAALGDPADFGLKLKPE
ncbi:MAG: hypothetical protein ABR987_10780 [Terracidiphilus sp.]|jgi:hypothetical protein